jgi:hypothetical protein
VMPWLVAAGFMLAGLVLVLNVRPDPKRMGTLLVERATTVRSPEKTSPLVEILRRPGVAVALLAAVTSQSIMIGTMSLTGYVLVSHGHHQAAMFLVVSAHFVGMFGLTLVAGYIIDRVGRDKALALRKSSTARLLRPLARVDCRERRRDLRGALRDRFGLELLLRRRHGGVDRKD